jgi:hypothetical protein
LHAPALTSTVASVQQISATRNMHSWRRQKRLCGQLI